MSRYGIITSDLKTACKLLQIGEGISQRFDTQDSDTYIVEAEYAVEDRVSEFIAIPLKPTRNRETRDSGTNDKRCYPQEFIQAIIYEAISRFLNSELFSNEPNQSDAAKWAADKSAQLILDFRSRTTVLVGRGRRRNPNPFIPPNIAPREKPGPS